MKRTFIILLLFLSNIINAQVSDFKGIDFTQADNIAKLNRGHSLKNLPILAHRLTHNLKTDVEKFRAIYVWVCNNITGDSSVESKVIRKRNKFKNDSMGFMAWNNLYQKTAFKKLLKQKRTLCTGYAYLIKELSFLVNIDCVIVDGYGRAVESNMDTLEMANHSWNAVKLNNKWYLCDATWSSGYFLNHAFIKDYNDGYFLTVPVLFAKNHFPLDKKWLLTDRINETEFITSPIVYGKTFEHQIIPKYPNNLNVHVKKNQKTSFRFKSLKKIPLKNISLVQYIGSEEHILKIHNLKNENGTISFNYNFKHKGLHDVHIKIANDIIASYTFNVTK